MFYKSNKNYMVFCLSFFAVSAVFSGVVQWLAFWKILSKTALNFLGIIIVSGNLFYYAHKDDLIPYITKIIRGLKVLTFGKLLIFILILLYLLSSLSPPTDADSLDYHLGFGKLILQLGGLYPRTDWMHYRLAGSGEYINAIGINWDVDNLGALMQFFSVVILLIFMNVYGYAKNKTIYMLSVLSSPILLFMINTQKYQIMPSIGLSIALMSCFVEEYSILLGILAVITCVFSVSAKVSFIITGLIVILFLLCSPRGISNKIMLLFVLLLSYALCGFPMHLFNYISYNDPFSPILQYYLNLSGDISAGRVYAVFMKDYKDHILPFPINLFIPGSIGTISTSLGAGTLLFLYLFKLPSKSNMCRFALVTILFALLFFSQNGNARFFLEGYFIGLLCVVVFYSGSVNNLIKNVILLQSVLILPFVIWGSFMVLGCVSSDYRDKIMSKYAYGYNICEEISKYIPETETVVGATRSNYLYKSKFMAMDRLRVADINNPIEKRKLLDDFIKYKVSYVVASNTDLKKYTNLGLNLKKIKTRSILSYNETRNPFNVLPAQQVYIYKINY